VICGAVNLAGGPVSALPAVDRLPPGQTRWQAGDPAAVAGSADSPELSTARHGALTCVLDGALYEPGAAGDNPADLVAAAYRRHGVAALASLRGRFAAIIWDADARSGVLATDVLATWQLYTYAVPGGLLFAGEIRDLLPLLPAQPPPDPAAFPAWLVSGACPEGRTLYKGIGRLGPGQCVAVGGGRATTRTYWEPRYAGTRADGRDAVVAGLRETILGVTARRLSPGTDGVILSGGLDSSIITAAAHAAKRPPGTVHTYSAVFPGAPYDEGDKIRALTGALGIDGRTFEIAPQGTLWQALRYLRDWRVPLAGMGSIIDLAAAARAGADGVSVMLDGQTGDEVLGFAPYVIADRLRRGRWAEALALIGRWPGRPPDKLHQKLWLLREFGIKGAASHQLGQRVRDRRVRQGDGAPWLLPHLRVHEAELEDRWAWKDRGTGPLWWRHLADLQVYGPHREPRLEYLRHRAAANGVAAASPLYDPDLIAYALSIPPQLQFDPATDRPLARAAMRGLLPESVRLQRRKADFSPFGRRAVTGADAPGLERVLTAPDALIGAYVDLEWVRRNWAVLCAGPPAQAPPLGVMWHLASAETWLRLQADPEWVDALAEDPAVAQVSVSDAAVTV
jgi:asparagine synthase (glutamine-hydrolysing)